MAERTRLDIFLHSSSTLESTRGLRGSHIDLEMTGAQGKVPRLGITSTPKVKTKTGMGLENYEFLTVFQFPPYTCRGVADLSSQLNKG